MQPFRCVRLGGVLLAILWFVFSPLSLHVTAQVSPLSPWLQASLPTLEKINDINLSQPLPQSIIGNQDCQPREVVTRPRRYVAPLQAKVSHIGCVVDTGSGAYSSTGYLQRQDSDVYGEVKTTRGDSAVMMPIPRSSTGLRLGGGTAYGTNLFFYDNLEGRITSTAIFNGEVTHKLPEHNAILSNGNGTILTANSVSFSANGDWMVVDIPFLALARVNVKTRQILPFGDTPTRTVGLGTAYRTAISPDGRYAIIASKNYEVLRLYDLSTCSTPPGVIAAAVACSSRDLLPYMRDKIAGFTSLASARFRSNYTLELHANSIIGNNTKLTRYVMTAAGQQTTGFQYLALGDSFASGEGAYNYKASTDVTDNKCHLSLRSYPYLISSALGYGQYESVACSGAKIEDVLNNTPEYRKAMSQSKGKFDASFDEEVYTNFLPGYRAQKVFIEQRLPSVVTISSGGNDIGFGDIILRCIDTDTCYDNYEDRLELANLINQQFYRFTSMYEELKTTSDPRTKIYVIGYPQIVEPNGTCDMNVHLNNDEIIFAQQLTRYLNGVIKKAAEYSGVYYVDVEDALDGYKMCEQINSWHVAVNGLTAGNDRLDLPFVHGPVGAESYHPNALGHDLLKIKILERTNDFTALMPTPNPDAKIADPDTSSEFLQSPKSNRTIRSIRHYTGTNGGIMRAGQQWSMRATNLDLVFAAGGKIDAWLHSNPVNLGPYTMGSDGAINITSLIPDTTQPGFHTLHLYGKSSSGEDIDVFKTVYVDSGSVCLVPLSGQDNDKDWVDDACDGFIDQPPQATKTVAALGTQVQNTQEQGGASSSHQTAGASTPAPSHESSTTTPNSPAAETEAATPSVLASANNNAALNDLPNKGAESSAGAVITAKNDVTKWLSIAGTLLVLMVILSVVLKNH